MYSHPQLLGTFKVIKIDPNGSGMDYSGHLGHTVKATRCCDNCTCLFGEDGKFGPFIPGELEPLDERAHKILRNMKDQYPITFLEILGKDYER